MHRIAVFARWPELGRVKTRLVPALTPGPTLRLHRGMLLDTLAAAAAAAADEHSVWWASEPPPDAEPELRALLEAGRWREHVQRGADLGARLARAFAELCSGDHDRAVVVGADAPEIDAGVIAEALGELDRSDVALGPAGDGGYYLIALARAAPALFHGVDWSTDRVLAQTLERAARERLRVTLTRKLDDLDAPEDLTRCIARALRREIRGPSEGDPSAGSRTLGGHTRRTLRELGLLPDAP